MTPQDRITQELERGNGRDIVALLDALIEQAQASRASDIHIDPEEGAIRVRIRTDGVLRDIYELPKELLSELITRIKIVSRLRTDEHQMAQDGRFRAETATARSLDIRVSVVPTYHGESAVLRLLSQQSEPFTLDSLGFSARNKETIVRAITRPHGMILATGPTGSGKTTTLYALLMALQSGEDSIITIEDPIEYAVKNVKQIPVNGRAGLTFASGLRSILRQDPDIIMVGEIRDQETAGLAVNTALTGHLLLSTMHTNDAATTLPRLLDMGIEPFLVASTVNIAIAQRLVRAICTACRFAPSTGCDQCMHSGYNGRVAIHEVLILDEPIRQAIVAKSSASEIRRLAIQAGMITMLEDGLEKVEQGLTTREEIMRVIHE